MSPDRLQSQSKVAVKLYFHDVSRHLFLWHSKAKLTSTPSPSSTFTTLQKKSLSPQRPIHFPSLPSPPQPPLVLLDHFYGHFGRIIEYASCVSPGSFLHVSLFVEKASNNDFSPLQMALDHFAKRIFPFFLISFVNLIEQYTFIYVRSKKLQGQNLKQSQVKISI